MSIKQLRLKRHGHWLGLAVLFVISLSVRTERAVLTTVVNPDAMRFIAQGKEFFINPLRAVRREVYHPLQSIAGTIVHDLLMIHLVGDTRMSWIYSMQTVGVVAGALVALEIFWLARRFGAPSWAAYCVAIIWIFGRKTGAYGADGISDMLFLSMLGASILTAMNTGLRCKPWYWFAAGIFSGLSYLTRPEGVAAVLIMLWALAIYHGVYVMSALKAKTMPSPLPFSRRRGVLPALISAGMLVVGYLIIGLPYMMAIGAFTRKKKLEIMNYSSPSHSAIMHLLRSLHTGHHVNLAFIGPSAFFHPWMWMKIAQEVFETLSPAACIVLLLALVLAPHVWGRRRWRPLVLGWAGLWITVMVWLLNIAGYLHGRHTLVLVLMLLPILALGLDRIARRWKVALKNEKFRARLSKWPAWLTDSQHPNRVSLILTGIVCIPGLVHLADAPQRGMRFIEDGARWLKVNARRNAVVDIGLGDDRRALVGYYSGLDYMFSNSSPFSQSRRQILTLSNHRPVIIDQVWQGNRTKKIPTTMGPFHLLKLRGHIVMFRAKQTLGANVLVFYVLPHQRVLSRAAVLPQPRDTP